MRRLKGVRLREPLIRAQRRAHWHCGGRKVRLRGIGHRRVVLLWIRVLQMWMGDLIGLILRESKTRLKRCPISSLSRNAKTGLWIGFKARRDRISPKSRLGQWGRAGLGE